jgi:hypothetical protein
MTDGREFDRQGIYQIRVKGNLDSTWSFWFDGFTLTLEENGVTVLTGVVIDQAALHSLLGKILNLGLPLLSVERVEHLEGDEKNE